MGGVKEECSVEIRTVGQDGADLVWNDTAGIGRNTLALDGALRGRKERRGVGRREEG